jgi:hypothetical protein
MQRGTYRAFAWIYVPGVNPQFAAVHSIDLFGMGQVVASGVTDSSVAVTGGTGSFRDARGEIRVATLSPTALVLEFDLRSSTHGR